MKKTTKLFFLSALFFVLLNVSNAQYTECAGTLTESVCELIYKFKTSGNNLDPQTECTFSIVAKDAATNNPSTITSPTTALMEPAPTPTADPLKAVALFSNVYTNASVDTRRAIWLVCKYLDNLHLAVNETEKYDTVLFDEIETTRANLIDFFNMKYLNADILTDNIISLKIKLVESGASGVYNGVVQEDDKNAELTFTHRLAGWDILLKHFTTLTTRAHIAQYIFKTASNGTNSFYLDYMYSSSEGTSSLLPVSGKINIRAKSQINEIFICNLLGQPLTDLKVTCIEKSIELCKVSTSNYFANVKLVNGQTLTQKYMKS